MARLLKLIKQLKIISYNIWHYISSMMNMFSISESQALFYLIICIYLFVGKKCIFSEIIK